MTLGTLLLVALFVLTLVALASVPFVHRWRTERAARREVESAPPPEPAPPPDAPPAPPPEAPPAQPAEPEPAPEPPAPERSLRDGLTRARTALRDRLGVIARRGPADSTYAELEEMLLSADVGVAATTALLAELRNNVSEQRITDGDQLVAELAAIMRAHLTTDRQLSTQVPDDGRTPVWLFVGVNGVGKTTTIGKVAQQQADEGKHLVLAAADTFRAAAVAQLETWADRVGAHCVKGDVGADPSSVVFDSVQAAAAREVDLVLADTAGRIQNKVNLMNELAKVRRVADREPGQVAEVLLVIDATTGQNGLAQAEAFAEATDVTGVVLTKLDGSAKGGIVFAIEQQLGIPVKLVGVGEGIADLVGFDVDEFVDALVGDS